jgi:hypothetical protein
MKRLKGFKDIDSWEITDDATMQLYNSKNKKVKHLPLTLLLRSVSMSHTDTLLDAFLWQYIDCYSKCAKKGRKR